MPGSQNQRSTLIQFLLDRDYATEGQISNLQDYMERNSVPLFEAINTTNILGNPTDVIRFIAEETGEKFFDLDGITPDYDALNYLPQDRAYTLGVFPYEYDHITNTLTLATSIEQVKNIQLLNDLRRHTGLKNIILGVAIKPDIQRATTLYYRPDAEFQRLTEEEEEDESGELLGLIESAPEALIGSETDEGDRVTKFVDLVLEQAVKDGVSDIHFDATETGIIVRYRIDGRLRDITYAPKHMSPNITARLKILSELDISKTREPQDGRITTKVGKKTIDLRVATLPSIHGEKVVMRVLDNTAAQKALPDLGFSPENLERFLASAQQPYGMVLVTGPTGSGKSTTLYAALNEIKTPELNIITAEDPVEYQLSGITQVPVHHNLTFEKVLRTVLRADPDVVLIGEVRDRETAEIAMKAGMTGHMVFSTLHTNDSASALTRLGDMGVEPFITASTVTAIVAQRLIRRLCERCKVEHHATAEDLKNIGYIHDEEKQGPLQLYKAVGCPSCNQGYRGRMAIHEVLVMADKLEEAILHGAKAYELNRLAIEEGMITMRQDGFRKAATGATTFEEVIQAIG